MPCLVNLVIHQASDVITKYSSRGQYRRQSKAVESQIFSMSTSYLSSPDQPSSVYPDRLIRPLPRKSLKSRLSQEAAESITFPPNPPSTNLPAYAQYGENGEYLNDSKVLVQHNGSVCDHDHHHDHDDDDDEHEHCPHHHCHHDHDEDDLDSTEDPSPIAFRQSSSYRSSPRSPRTRNGRYASHGGKSSSANDGYEAFENTNNKKKRKIPTSGGLSLHHPMSLSSDLAALGVNRDVNGDESYGYYGSPAASGLGLQGAGRGRTHRKSSIRNPLGVSVNGLNLRNGVPAHNSNMSVDTQVEDNRPDQGIISAAIANATALLRKPLNKGQENVGVLDHQTKTTPSNSQFTFTCESEAKDVKFPEQSLYSPDYSQRVNTSVPQASPLSSQKHSAQPLQSGIHASPHNQQIPALQQSTTGNINHARKQRRRKGDVYASAAQQRKLQQEYMNLQHTPSPDDIWICEFCEYESIFGEPPRALIRQYEIKDRRQRQRLAEKQRLLEKAKLKGRKSKKQTKNATKASNSAVQPPVGQQSYDRQPLDPADEYLGDGFDDDPSSLPVLPPQLTQKQPMPGSYQTSKVEGAEIDRGKVR